MVMQAWGNYGTVWSVVHQQLGVSPYLGDGALRVVPEIPAGQPSVTGSNIRLGDGAIDVSAARVGANAYRTSLTLHGLRVPSVEIGYTLPADSSAANVVLDGQRLRHYHVTDTNRGVEVTAPVQAPGPHTLVVTSA
jgi:hypothetical protein